MVLPEGEETEVHLLLWILLCIWDDMHRQVQQINRMVQWAGQDIKAVDKSSLK